MHAQPPTITVGPFPRLRAITRLHFNKVGGSEPSQPEIAVLDTAFPRSFLSYYAAGQLGATLIPSAATADTSLLGHLNGQPLKVESTHFTILDVYVAGSKLGQQIFFLNPAFNSYGGSPQAIGFRLGADFATRFNLSFDWTGKTINFNLLQQAVVGPVGASSRKRNREDGSSPGSSEVKTENTQAHPSNKRSKVDED